MENSSQSQNPLQKMMSSGGGSQGQDASGQKKGAPILDTTIQRVFSDLNNMTRRVRLLEERFLDIRKKIELMEENSLNLDKSMHTQNKATLDTISEQKKALSDMKEKMNIMIKELQGCAKLTDQKVLEKYISMWEPINYVTSEEMDRNVGHLIDLKMSELNLKIQQENFIKKEIERQLSMMKLSSQNMPNLPQAEKTPVASTSEQLVKKIEKSEKMDFAPVSKNTSAKPVVKAQESETELSYDDEVPVEEKKTPKEKDEVEEITNEINNMFKKRNEVNGLSGTDSEEDDEDSIDDLIRK